MSLFPSRKIGIDLGSTNTLIYIYRKGIVLREPSLVAVRPNQAEVIAYGKEAKELVGRTSEKIELIHPIQSGVIHHFSLTKQMLAHFIQKSTHRKMTRPEVVISVPSNISKVERRAVIDALREIGINRAMLVDVPVAAIIGAGVDISEPLGQMVVDIGGGTTDIGTFSFGEMIERMTIPVGGVRMNQLIQAYVRVEHQLVISDEASERLKLEIGNANYTKSDAKDQLTIQGRHATLGTPKEVTIRAQLVANALSEAIDQIIVAIRQVLQRTSPELSADIMNEGIILTGGGALLKRLPERLKEALGVDFHLADQAMDCVAIGAGRLLESFDDEARRIERMNR